ncbi:hypothetical protein BU24DRAFT_451043 [Aaosphaeria arxii CBS 175.79]|uniref:Mediator of RNA polymerase II transcription subunit 6 n=1 Tax=Aaosphaeria arxii CBS 175.79 TaxID=1450172 RepID=A0A6A5XUD8_9PLEO|nr:uncharacterized protein BU24DRAFT_451043 [Aaosphaeria arxii CBS 175.79]KAF2016539.1 hypothetical protein BU24DRAFT_451043 [Aaosphaeria arxii CBS 175.79]
MSLFNNPAPDEQMFYDPDAFYRDVNFGETINSDNVMWYFSRSPWYDQQSNNNAFILQTAGLDINERNAIWQNRHNFERMLSSRFPLGIQYVVTGEAQSPGQPWVIQRQNRVKEIEDDGSEVTRTYVEAVYYVVGFAIFMAPSVGDIIRSRLQTISTSLQDIFEMGLKLDSFTPSTGHTYIPSDLESSKQQAAAGSFSRAGSVVPSEIDSSQNANTQSGGDAEMTEFSDDLFLQSLMLTTRYGNEYADENPLQGEPGSFVFTNTNQAVEARNKAQAAAQANTASIAAAATLKQAEAESIASVAPTPKPPPPEAVSRKGSISSLPKAGKEKRRKSKGLASPISPPGA